MSDDLTRKRLERTIVSIGTATQQMAGAIASAPPLDAAALNIELRRRGMPENGLSFLAWPFECLNFGASAMISAGLEEKAVMQLAHDLVPIVTESNLVDECVEALNLDCVCGENECARHPIRIDQGVHGLLDGILGIMMVIDSTHAGEAQITEEDMIVRARGCTELILSIGFQSGIIALRAISNDDSTVH